MTVSTDTHTSGPYQGDGSTKQFGVEFPFLDESHLKVILTSDQGETELALQQDYQATRNKKNKGYIQLVHPLPLGSKLTITRNIPFTQTAQYAQGDAFPAASHEQALDKLTMLAQQLKANAGRTIKSPHGENIDLQLPSFANRRNKLLGFDDESVPQAITIGNGLNLSNNLISVKDGVGILSNKDGIHILYGQGLDVFDGAIVVSAGNGLTFDEQTRLEIEHELIQIIKATKGELIDLEGFVNFLAKRVSNLEIGSGGEEVTIHIGNGLQFDQKGNLTIKPHTGILVDSDGVSVRIGDLLEAKDGVINVSEAFRNEVNELKQRVNNYKPELGMISLMPFRATSLPFGWHHANGDQFSVSSTIGKALKALPTDYKADWKIIESEGMINIPNMYHGDGRGYFMRAGVNMGVVQEDAIRNIYGEFSTLGTPGNIDKGNGVFDLKAVSIGGRNTASGYGARDDVIFDTSKVVPTAEENRPLNIALTPTIYLGM